MRPPTRPGRPGPSPGRPTVAAGRAPAAGGSPMEVDGDLPVLRRTNTRFAEVAAAAALRPGWQARVPGCPDWTLADLVWHLAKVQHFWGWIVRTRASDPSAYPEPARRPDDELLGWGSARSAELEAVLAGADPRDRVWTWAPQQDVAF